MRFSISFTNDFNVHNSSPHDAILQELTEAIANQPTKKHRMILKYLKSTDCPDLKKRIRKLCTYDS